MKWFTVWIVVYAATTFGPISLAAEHAGRLTADLETGVVYTGYNDVRIPGDTGTTFSLSEDVESDKPVFWRGRISYRLGSRHCLSVLVAPLTIEARGTLEKEIVFRDAVFPMGTRILATYRFDSYRLTYRYELAREERLQIGAGITAKVRDAAISLAGGDVHAEKTNTGFVPLINLRIQWLLGDRVGFLIDGDALAAPQGRAEDLLIAIKYTTTDRFGLRGGYRLLEGGADNDEVYTFALLHYLSLGIEWTF